LANSFDKGTLVRISATFINQAGTAVDPTTVTCTVVDGNGASVSSGTASKDSTGNYHYDVDTTSLTGGASYYYQFKGTGTNQGADEDEFAIRKSHF
jgi:uncharacterized protein YfaS (alpha-2-macroglobulin family)